MSNVARRGAALGIALATVGAALVGGPPVAADSHGDETPDGTTTTGRLVLVLDSSGSMKEPAAGGSTRIEAARTALRDVVDRLPDEAEVGVRVFGATVFSRGDKRACSDTQNVVPVGPLDRDAVLDQVADYKPYGETPIGAALKGAARDLGDDGRRTVVLLSDGEPTCAPDPCVVARQLRQQGVGLEVNVVGLDVDGAARRALQCIARAGGGSYFDVDDPEELSASLVDVSVRALREFQVEGTPLEVGEDAATAPPATPGDHLVTLPRGQENGYVEVDKEPGAGLSVSVTGRPDAESSIEFLGVRLLTPEGDVCADGEGSRTNVLAEKPVVSAGALYVPGAQESEPESCAEAERLVVEVDHGETGSEREFELVIASQPGFTGALEELPEPVADTEPYAVPARASGAGATPVVGGTGFRDAPVLEPGTYTDTLRPGEQLFYRVPVGWGQSMSTTFELGPEPRAAELLGVQGDTGDANLYNPWRQPVSMITYGADRATGNDFYNGEEPTRLTAALAPVTMRNLDADGIYLPEQAWAGHYFVAVRLGALDDDTEFVAPVTIAVQVDGEAQAAPQLDGELAVPDDGAAATEVDAAQSADEDDTEEQADNADADAGSGTSSWLPYVVVLVLVGLLVAAAVSWVLRGRTAPRRGGGDAG